MTRKRKASKSKDTVMVDGVPHEDIEGMLVPAHWNENNKKNCRKVRSSVKKMASAPPDLRHALMESLSLFEDDCGVACSGGLDSQAILWSLIDLGKKPTVFSVCFEHQISSDFLSAKQTAEYFGLEFVPVFIPYDADKYYKFLKYIIHKQGITSKPSIECLYPMMLLIKEAEKRCRYLAFGHGGDIYYNLARKAEMFGKDILYESRLAQFRGGGITYGPKGQETILTRYALKKGIFAMFPYLLANVYAQFQTMTTWEETNKPQKRIVRETWPQHLKPCKVKNHSNMQLGDGDISGNLGNLILESEHNVGNWKSQVGVYNHIAKQKV